MIEEKEPCLILRNKTSREQETYCKHYTKRLRGYLRHLFLQIKSVGLILGILFELSIYLPISLRESFKNEPLMDGCFIGLMAVFALFWIYEILKGIWFWKYAKHVVVTDEGIWLMYYSTFWWSEDFRGKKRFLSPSWSLYSWEEIKLSLGGEPYSQSQNMLIRFFSNYEIAVIRSAKLTSILISRWDGNEPINFLNESDADDILSYYKERKRKKKKTSAEN